MNAIGVYNITYFTILSILIKINTSILGLNNARLIVSKILLYNIQTTSEIASYESGIFI